MSGREININHLHRHQAWMAYLFKNRYRQFSPEVVEDLISDVCYRILKYTKTETITLTYIKTVCHAAAMDYFNKHKLDCEPLSEGENLAAEPHYVDRINTEMLINSLSERIEEPELKDMFFMRCHDHPLKDICDKYDMTINQVKRRLTKVRQHFKEEDFLVGCV
jgi:DNA-directed RNA polymerase specialized sigma24 family protein